MSKKWIAFFTLVITALIFGVLNYMVGGFGGNVRLDLTQDKVYTLSDATKNILDKLKDDRQVKVRMYVTGDKRDMPSQLTDYARTVEDLLVNLVDGSNGKLVLEKIEANPDTEEEDKAMADEIQGMPVSKDKKIYLGLAIQCLQQKEVIGFLDPNQESRLEYDIIRAIRKVSSTKKPVIGVLSSLPIAGSQATPQMMMQGQQGQRAWIAIQRLEMDFEVKTVEATAEKIDDDIKALLVVQPTGLSERTEWAIDQFVLRGGRLIAFLDSNCLTAKAAQPRNPMMMMAPPETSSNFRYLLKTWGVNWDPTQVVADMTYQRSGGPGAPPMPTIIGLDEQAVSKDDAAMAQLRSIMMYNAGAFNFEKTDGLTKTALLQSSVNSEMIDSTAAESALRGELKSFLPSNKRQTLALRITGKFKTSFPGGQPPKVDKPQDPNNPAPKEEKKPEEKPEPGLTESPDDKGMVVLVSDVDMISDQGAVQMDERSGQAELTSNNLDLLLNVMEQSAMEGGSDLMKVRSRAVLGRPFTKMNELQESIDARFRPEMSKLAEQLDATSRAMGSIKVTQTKEGNLALMMTPDQIKKKDELDKTMVELRTKKRELDKQRTREMDSVQSRIKWLNILGMPLIVALLGLILAVNRRRSTAAA